MADALLSPAVGVGFLAASGAGLAYSARRLARESDEKKAPLMGVMGAFVFAAQMINFTIPGTGSSGHLGGGLLLALLLGPYAAFITIASVLIVQALFFADGGILALGTNIWNMGFYPALVWFGINRVMRGREPGRAVFSAAAVLGAVIALELGALSVAAETVLSGRTELPFGRFALVMAGIHLPIGIVEGMVTAAVLNLVFRLRPEIVWAGLAGGPAKADAGSHRPVLAAMIAAALLAGGMVAWLASAHPDGLEWAIQRIAGQEELKAADSGLAPALAAVQEKTALLPDYDFRKDAAPEKEAEEEDEEGGAGLVSPGTSFSGVAGSLLVLALVGAVGLVLYRLRGPAAGPGREGG